MSCQVSGQRGVVVQRGEWTDVQGDVPWGLRGKQLQCWGDPVAWVRGWASGNAGRAGGGGLNLLDEFGVPDGSVSASRSQGKAEKLGAPAGWGGSQAGRRAGPGGGAGEAGLGSRKTLQECDAISGAAGASGQAA